MDMVNVTINGIAVSVPKGSTILQAARAAGVDVPTLCYLKEINEIAACRICVVEAAEMRGATLGPARVVTACGYPDKYRKNPSCKKEYAGVDSFHT